MPATLIPGIILDKISDRKLKIFKNKARIQCFPDAYSFATHSDCRSSDKVDSVTCGSEGDMLV